MPVLCTISGILCLIYFIFLILYSGFTSAFYLIWPAMAAGFFLLRYLLRIHFWRYLPPVLRGILFVLISCGFIFFLYVESLILREAFVKARANLDYVIVLGAHVRSDGPSRALSLRLDKALEYAKKNPDTIFIVSGGQGSNEPCTESSAMKRYLTNRGLEPEQILEEDRSTNTRENLIFSKKMIPSGASVGIVSNSFHICRALHLAKKLGFPDASGIPAKSDLPTQPANLLREFFAVVKDFWLYDFPLLH